MARPFETLKISGTSDPTLVAGAIAGTLREHGRCTMEAIGPNAVNQLLKAVAVARGYVAPQGMDLWCQPSFCDVVLDGVTKTAIRVHVLRWFGRVPEPEGVLDSPDSGML